MNINFLFLFLIKKFGSITKERFLIINSKTKTKMINIFFFLIGIHIQLHFVINILEEKISHSKISIAKNLKQKKQ